MKLTKKFKSNFTRALVGLTLTVTMTSYAYVLMSSSWPLGRTTFFVQWDAGGVYDTAFINAINDWNGKSAFNFTVDTSRFVDPCLSTSTPDRVNGYRFSADDCGRGFGASTLAVTWTWRSGPTTVDTDIIFNSNFSWGLHNNASATPYDFNRIAVHELGHALGLDHETINPAIMQPNYSLTIMVPQVDDINGEIAIYGPGAIDTQPPTPNPMTWSMLPTDASTTQIDMVASIATDPSGPVEYQFTATDLSAGGGATSSLWQAGNTYSDLGLGVNHQYQYSVVARDAAATPNITTPTMLSSEFTAIEASSGVAFGGITSTSIQVNSINTPSGLLRGISGVFANNATNLTNSGWKQDNGFWDDIGLLANTQYSYTMNTRNGDGEVTGESLVSSAFTLASAPTPAAFTGITPTNIGVNWTANGNPVGTEYFVENITTVTNSGWITTLSWDSFGLSCGTGYGFRVQARNGAGIVTAWSSLGNVNTQPCLDSDGDSIPDNLDNCINVPNSNQLDTNNDGFGNICDADLDNSMTVVDITDFFLFRNAFGSADPDSDFNGDGTIDITDFFIFRDLFGLPPGPSGLVP